MNEVVWLGDKLDWISLVSHQVNQVKYSTHLCCFTCRLSVVFVSSKEAAAAALSKETMAVVPSCQAAWLPIQLVVESRSWRDRNLKFGPNCYLEVDNLEK